MSFATPPYKDLDEVVVDALNFHTTSSKPDIQFPASGRMLAIASGNALPTAKVMLADYDVTYCDEGDFLTRLAATQFDRAVVVSASGQKHAPIILQALADQGVDAYLITCTAESPSTAMLASDRVFVTEAQPEPPTYNTFSYLGMILGATQEDPQAILAFIEQHIEPIAFDFKPYSAFYLMVDNQFDPMLSMFAAKFDELFSGMLGGRFYTVDQTLHAKSVVPCEHELYLSFGAADERFGHSNLNIPLPENAGFAAVMTVGYYVIGKIQKANPPWFKDAIEDYMAHQTRLFADK